MFIIFIYWKSLIYLRIPKCEDSSYRGR